MRAMTEFDVEAAELRFLFAKKCKKKYSSSCIDGFFFFLLCMELLFPQWRLNMGCPSGGVHAQLRFSTVLFR
jgi:hypothetical protein